jgi:hypothetical protein
MGKEARGGDLRDLISAFARFFLSYLICLHVSSDIVLFRLYIV